MYPFSEGIGVRRLDISYPHLLGHEAIPNQIVPLLVFIACWNRSRFMTASGRVLPLAAPHNEVCFRGSPDAGAFPASGKVRPTPDLRSRTKTLGPGQVAGVRYALQSGEAALVISMGTNDPYQTFPAGTRKSSENMRFRQAVHLCTRNLQRRQGAEFWGAPEICPNSFQFCLR